MSLHEMPKVNDSAREGMIELDEKKLEQLLLWSFYFSQGAGGFLRRDDDGQFVDVTEDGLHCFIFEFLATKHPNYKIDKNFNHSAFLKTQIPMYVKFLTSGPHSRIDPKEIPGDVGMAYRYLRMALNDRKYMRRDIKEPSLVRFAQKMIERDWVFLTNAMQPSSRDFEFTERPERAGVPDKGFAPTMSQFVKYVLLRKKGEPIEIATKAEAPLVSPVEYVELLDAVAASLRDSEVANAFNSQSDKFDSTYSEMLRVLIERHNALNPNEKVPTEAYSHLIK